MEIGIGDGSSGCQSRHQVRRSVCGKEMKRGNGGRGCRLRWCGHKYLRGWFSVVVS